MSLATEDSLSSHEKTALYLAHKLRALKGGKPRSDTIKEKHLEHKSSATHLGNVKLVEKRDAKRKENGYTTTVSMCNLWFLVSHRG